MKSILGWRVRVALLRVVAVAILFSSAFAHSLGFDYYVPYGDGTWATRWQCSCETNICLNTELTGPTPSGGPVQPPGSCGMCLPATPCAGPNSYCAGRCVEKPFTPSTGTFPGGGPPMTCVATCAPVSRYQPPPRLQQLCRAPVFPSTRSMMNRARPSVVAGIELGFDRAFTEDRIEDFTIRTPLGDVPFVRTYFSDDRVSLASVSDAGLALLSDVPKPFGSSPTDLRSVRWTHNFASFVDRRLGADGGGRSGLLRAAT